jgi:aminoglycoside 3-N-acetyltransferase
MQAVTSEQLIADLRALGVCPGDGLLIHSAVQFLGRPAGGIEMYYRALCQLLGIEASVSPPSPQGTLVVPAFNFAFARGEPYDPRTTPSDGMGAFAEYVRTRPEARRTPHPMQSLVVVGAYAGDLAQRDTPAAFDPGSAFERMLELDFKLLLLGADIQSVSMLHFSEQRANVPYRYWKEFSGQYRTPAGWERRTYRMFVRDLEIDPQIELYPVQEVLRTAGKWQAVTLNYGLISACRLRDFVTATDGFLAADPWSLVVNRPAEA